MRNRFDQQLETLNAELITMGALCEEAVMYAMQALFKGDMDMAEKAFEAERQIDQKEREIENLCMRLLLQQQPVAGDLRVISSALKMISDMERIGDHAEDIAEIAGYIEEGEGIPQEDNLQMMARAASSMVTESVDSFVKKDLELAEKVIRLTNSKSKLIFKPLPHDDPKQRQPDITLAKEKLGWEPTIELEEGLQYIIEYFKEYRS